MDFIVDVFNMIPLKAAVIIMFLTWFISRMVGRDIEGRLPAWFPGVPLAIGVIIGIPAYLLEHIEQVALQPFWVTALRSLEQGVTYGAVAIGLWSSRSIIPYFKGALTDKDT